MENTQETIVTKHSATARLKGKLRIQVPADEFRSIPIPGLSGHPKLGDCFVRVTDLPSELDGYMEVNPRVPNRSKKGILSGPVVKGIISTLRDNPEEMALKNQGIYLLAQEASWAKEPGGQGFLDITLTDPHKHGVVNGGHTYAAIREAVDQAEGEELESLKRAFVRVHIMQGIDEDFVPEIAEGLNRSKQVDDPSLINLQGEFDVIRRAMSGKIGEKAIAYRQGDDGDIYISEILVYLGFFNLSRFSDKKHPNQLYKKQGLGLKYFGDDMAERPKKLEALIEKLPDILWLSDAIRKHTPEAARKNNFEFGRIKLGAERAGSAKNKGTNLPFLGEAVDWRVPNGWIFPMLAAFRANLRTTPGTDRVEWKVPLPDILPQVIDELVGVCVVEHRDNNMRPELIGNRESAYSQCYDKIQLFLARRSLL